MGRDLGDFDGIAELSDLSEWGGEFDREKMRANERGNFA
jgi:hypothetical protein